MTLILLVLALACFIIASAGVTIGRFNPGWAGLVFLTLYWFAQAEINFNA